MVPVSHMIQRDYLIIGGGIGGASACEGIRRHDKRGCVTLVGAEVFPPYKRWILSKGFLREKDPQPRKLLEPNERLVREAQDRDAIWRSSNTVQHRSAPGSACQRRKY